jgi:hypothetical protein
MPAEDLKQAKKIFDDLLAGRDSASEEFKKAWGDKLEATGRNRNVPQNNPWQMRYVPNYQESEDMFGLTQSEKFIPGSGLEVSTKVHDSMVDVVSSSLTMREPWVRSNDRIIWAEPAKRSCIPIPWRCKMRNKVVFFCVSLYCYTITTNEGGTAVRKSSIASDLMTVVCDHYACIYHRDGHQQEIKES